MNRIATFECSTSQTGHTLTFAYTASVDVNFTVNDLSGGGKQVIAQFPVTPEVNSSTVGCLAEDDNGNLLGSTSLAYVYAQGKNCYLLLTVKILLKLICQVFQLQLVI